MRPIASLLAALLARRAAAETRVIQAMTTPGWLGTVSQNVWNPRDSRLEMTEAGNATRVAYTIGPVAGSTIRGVASFGRSTQFNCAGATELALNYRVLEPQSDPHSVHLRLSLLEGSECGAGCDASWPGRSLENYVSFQPLLLDDVSGKWHTLRVDLCGGPGPDKPFWRSDSYGSLGDGALDVSALRGWTIAFVGPAVMRGASSGVLEFAELACDGPRVFGNVLDGPTRAAAPPEWSISPVAGPGTVAVTVGGGALRVAFEGVSRQSVTVRHELPPDARYEIDTGAVTVRIDPGNAESVSIAVLDGGSASTSTAGELVVAAPEVIMGVEFVFTVEGTGAANVSDLHAAGAPLLAMPECDGDAVGDGRVEGVVFEGPADRFLAYGQQDCREHCRADEACLYFMIDGGRGIAEERACHLFYSLARGVRPATADEASRYQAFWYTDAARRGWLCDVCDCAAGGADCTGRDLATAPAADGVRSVDLRGNPRLTLLAPNALSGAIERVWLPEQLEHVAADAVPAGAVLELPATPAPSNIVAASTEAFSDPCYGLGEEAHGVIFGEYAPYAAGVDAAYFEDTRYPFTNVVYEITGNSDFLAEAAESRDTCAAYCQFNDVCEAFTFIKAGAALQDTCRLHPSADGASPAPPSAITKIWAGIPPRTRAAQGATVISTPTVVHLEKQDNGWLTGEYSVSLGSAPTRGAVWVTPEVRSQRCNVTFTPDRVVLYDANVSATVEVTVYYTSKSEVTVRHAVEACDAAFTDVEVAVALVRPPGSSNKDNSHRRKARNLRIAMITLGAILGAALVTWSCVRGRESLVRARRLARERRRQVHDQILEARSLLREFRSLFATVKGDEFLGLGGVGGATTHETLLDTYKLQLFDGVAKCDAARKRGEVFMFLSHQWTAFEEPDPTGVQYDAMCAAVRAVAREAGVGVEALHVWVDILAIPQRNRALQRMAIESLPAFASTCDYFVVVAPPCSHQNGDACDIDSFRARAWCRAEVMSCWAMRGADCMYLSAGEGLVPLLAGNDDALAEHIDVFGGDLTCCARGHPDHVCDREALVKPMLGLFVEIYSRHRNPRDGVPEPPRAAPVTYVSPDSIIRTTPDLEEQRAQSLTSQRTPHTPRARPPKDAYAVVEPLLAVSKSTSVSGAPDDSSRSHFTATTRPCWLRRVVMNRHRHAIEQASRRWRGGRRDDSAPTRSKI